MPRSSRSKSHKQSKHSSKDAAASSTAKDYSGSDEDVKIEKRSSNGGKEDGVSFRLSKDSSVSGERRKHGKDLFSSHGNGDVSEEYTTSSKRREEKSHGGSDRWNGGSSDEKVIVVNIENKESSKSKDFSKVVGESKSKSSRKHDLESASVVVLEKDEGKNGSGNRGEKRKSEKESARKENSQYKESKESKDKDRGSDRGRKSHSDKHETEASSKQVENQSSKRGKESTDWPIEEGLRNPELEKELEKRMRRRGEGSSDKDKKDEGVRETRQRDEKHREDGEKDRKSRDVKHRGESERYSKHRDDKHHEDGSNKDKKYHEDGKRRDEKHMESGEKDERSRDGKRKQDDEREYRHKEEKHHRDVRHRDEEKRSRESKYTSKEHPIEPEAKRLRDDSASTDLYHRKTSNRDGSPVYDDRTPRYKDDKDRRRGNDKDKEEGSSDHRSRSSMKSESEKRSSTKGDSVSERGRPGSRHVDMEITGSHSHSHSRRRSSPPSRDHHRVSKQDESKYRDYAYEERGRHNVQSSRDYTSASGQSDKPSTQKATQKDNDSWVRPDTRSSPQVDKSPSDPRKSIDLEDPGQRSGGGGGGSKDAVKDPHPDNEYSQVDGDNLSVSSPYTRSCHFSEDERNKSNNRHRRMGGDPNNMGRPQNNWKNVPNWPSPMAASGYMAFQHVPPPMFHPLMQQFPPPMFGRPPMKLPYHVPDHNRPLAWRDESVPPPPLHGWDANNNPVFGDESHLYWDRRNQMNNRGWDPNADMWKSQNSMDVQQPGSVQRPSDEIWSTGQGVENEESQVEIQVGERNTAEAEKVTESIPEILEAGHKKEDDNSLILQAYLSRVDISEELTEPEVYEQCRRLMDLDHGALSDEFDCKILFVEEGVEANGGSLFAGINDCVFEKAMLFYKKQKEEFDSVKEVDEEKSAEEADKENDEAVERLDVKEEGNDEPKKMEVDDVVVVVVKQEMEVEVEESGGCKVEEEEEVVVVSDDVSIEFGSVVNLSRIHHHSPAESTH